VGYSFCRKVDVNMAVFLKVPRLGVISDYPGDRLSLTCGDEVLDVSTPVYARTPDCFFVKVYELLADWMERKRDYRVTFFCESHIQKAVQLFTGTENTKLSKIITCQAPEEFTPALSFKLHNVLIDVLQIGVHDSNAYAMARDTTIGMNLRTPDDLYFFVYAVLDLFGFTIDSAGVKPIVGQPVKSKASYFLHDSSIAVSNIRELQSRLPSLVAGLH
jgi:hypothetical protein